MLEPIKHVLSTRQIILASSSPRRQEILNSVGLKFKTCPSNYEEDLDPTKYSCLGDFVMDTAHHKVLEISDRLKSEIEPTQGIIIGADTIVSLDGKVLGKPNSIENAYEMLQKLSGRQHTVFTGVVLKSNTRLIQFFSTTKVHMDTLSPDTIKSYIDTGEPMDKAGGYGIQGLGGSLIHKIEGDYYTVMGLPLNNLCKHLIQLVEEEAKKSI